MLGPGTGSNPSSGALKRASSGAHDRGCKSSCLRPIDRNPALSRTSGAPSASGVSGFHATHEGYLSSDRPPHRPSISLGGRSRPSPTGPLADEARRDALTDKRSQSVDSPAELTKPRSDPGADSCSGEGRRDGPADTDALPRTADTRVRCLKTSPNRPLTGTAVRRPPGHRRFFTEASGALHHEDDREAGAFRDRRDRESAPADPRSAEQGGPNRALREPGRDRGDWFTSGPLTTARLPAPRTCPMRLGEAAAGA